MKLCTVTGSRAEFFILRNFILKIQKDRKIIHSLLVTGSHNSNFFGNTIQDIKKSNIKITSRIDLKIKNDRPRDISN